MHRKDFDKINVTTATMIAELQGEALIQHIFPLIEFTTINLPEGYKPKSNKLPFCGVPGAIISGCYKNITRGIVKKKTKNKKNKNFRNSISMDICVSTKNVNVKLSSEKIHMTGLKSIEMAHETATHILNHINRIQDDLDYIHSDEARHLKITDWVKEHTKGEYYIIDTETQDIIILAEGEKLDAVVLPNYNSNDNDNDNPQEVKIIRTVTGEIKHKELATSFQNWHPGDNINSNKVVCDKSGNPYKTLNEQGDIVDCVYEYNFFYYPNDDNGNITKRYFVNENGNTIKLINFKPITVQEVFSIKIPEEYSSSYPTYIDQRIANFYIRQSPNFIYYHNWCIHIDNIREIKNVKSENLQLKQIREAMVNKSYGLNVKINRWKLANRINGYNGFIARFCNTNDHAVTINLPYELTDEMKKIRRKGKKPQHTFLVYKSGIITQSGPSLELMEGAYNQFMDVMEKIRDEVTIPKSKFNVKFTRKRR